MTHKTQKSLAIKITYFSIHHASSQKTPPKPWVLSQLCKSVKIDMGFKRITHNTFNARPNLRNWVPFILWNVGWLMIALVKTGHLPTPVNSPRNKFLRLEFLASEIANDVCPARLLWMYDITFFNIFMETAWTSSPDVFTTSEEPKKERVFNNSLHFAFPLQHKTSRTSVMQTIKTLPLRYLRTTALLAHTKWTTEITGTCILEKVQRKDGQLHLTDNWPYEILTRCGALEI